jgi:hypothetical protein
MAAGAALAGAEANGAANDAAATMNAHNNARFIPHSLRFGACPTWQARPFTSRLAVTFETGLGLIPDRATD